MDRADLLDEYQRVVDLAFRGERYFVRDNGAVFRVARPGQRKRQLDDTWTFGRPCNSTGYMHIGSHRVHQVVAAAFHERPSEKHVVDHIDTNRKNNRADNLRWVTRLENLLLNPITLAKIVQCYGSLDAFFEDPSANSGRDQDFSWMRTVTEHEAAETRRRLLKWAESGQVPQGGQLGDWVMRSQTPHEPSVIRDIQSLTPLAVQRGWRVAGEFPACPASLGADPLGEYLERLASGTVFFSNATGTTVTELAGRNDSVLGVVGRMEPATVKEWALAKIQVENNRFVHESVRTSFTYEGAVNAYSRLLGIGPPYEPNIDDFC